MRFFLPIRNRPLGRWALAAGMLAGFGSGALRAGPYSAAAGDPGNVYDAPVPGFVGPEGPGRSSGGQFVNPIFGGWASGVVAYEPAPGVAAVWSDPSRALGPVTGNLMDVVALGDLDAAAIDAGEAPGSITLTFDRPIRDYSGADFVVFENGLVSEGGAGIGGEIFAELAHVEVSGNGRDFVRLPSRFLVAEPVGAYGTLDATSIRNLAGKHVNAFGESWGTPFFLEDLETHPKVLDGTVNRDAITHVRIVDIPGSGAFRDGLGNPIYDSWPTFGSGGFDLEALGVISVSLTYADWIASAGAGGDFSSPEADASGNGMSDLLEYATGGHPVRTGFKPGVHGVSVETTEAGGAFALRFVRDERATDLLYEVQVSENLRDWQTIAQSAAGAPVAGEPGVRVEESSASPVASIGVLRQVTVFDAVPLSTVGRRFVRLKVSLSDGN